MARRQAARHARRVRRITPRRWLPFVALLAVVAGAVVVSRQDQAPDPVRDRPPAAATRLPVASRADALSTAWYCAGGSAQGPGGPAELSVVIANAESEGTTAEVTAVGSEGGRATTTVAVPADGRVRVVAADLLTDAWVGLTVEVLGGRATVEREVEGPLGFDASPCSANAATRWYVPSGSTVRGAQLDLVLYNPFPDDTSVDITFATDQGIRSPRALKGFAIPGRSLRVVPQDALPSRRPEVAATISARTGRLVVDRVQRYDGTGDAVPGTGADPVATPAPVGLASTAAVPARADRWIIPDAMVVEGARTQVAVHNPGTRTARVDVVIAHEDPARYPEVEPVQLTVRPRSEEVVDVTQVVGITPRAPFTVDVRSLDGVTITAELLSFGALAPADDAAPAEDAPPPGDEAEAGGEAEAGEAEVAPAEAVPGFAVVPGAPVGATTWFLASRGGSLRRSAAVVVANPGSAPVAVRVTELTDGRRDDVAGASVTLAPGDRRVLDLSTGATSSALLVRADGPVVVGHSLVGRQGRGVAQALGTPFPESVRPLPDLG
ncbi:MAG: hypothetical protein KF703_19645 [Actinobacteria bacterium]|nr:hypothetical protein [Actinomycetota bacterium]